jgi:hypothetical protein
LLNRLKTDPHKRETQLAAERIFVATKLKLLFVFEPNVVIATMQTTIIRASITAYSTAVGPSSRFRKFTTERTSDFMDISPGGRSD